RAQSKIAVLPQRYICLSIISVQIINQNNNH
ncbi:MAG: hypothetical protein ACI90V_011866, partial [Bacillariaceae sp.]